MMIYRSMMWIVCMILVVSNFISCAKEYSFENGSTPGVPPATDTASRSDTSGLSRVILRSCKACEIVDTSSLAKWRFTSGSASLCGLVTKGVASPDRTAMTFFGPSACSIDSGLIITAYFNSEVFDRDRSNLTASFAAMEYYDNTTGFDVLKSSPSTILSLNITAYNHLNKTATGTFSGWVIDKNGAATRVDNGQFRIKF